MALVGFLLFFLVGYGFALSDEERVLAWVQTAIISCGTWLCLTTPLKILLKTTFQMFGLTMSCAKICCCRKPGSDRLGVRGARGSQKSKAFSGFETELSRMKAEMNTIHKEISRDRRRAKIARPDKMTAHARTRPSRAEAKLSNDNAGASLQQQHESSEHRRRSLDEKVEDMFMASHTMAYSPAREKKKKKRWSLHYEAEGGRVVVL